MEADLVVSKLTEPWSSLRLGNIPNKTTLEQLTARVRELEPATLCRVLLSLLHLRPHQIREMQHEIGALVDKCAHLEDKITVEREKIEPAQHADDAHGVTVEMKDFEWVKVIASILRNYAQLGFVDEEHGSSYVLDLARECQKAVFEDCSARNEGSLNKVWALPSVARYLDTSLLGDIDELAASLENPHFAVTKPFNFDPPVPRGDLPKLQSNIPSKLDGEPRSALVNVLSPAISRLGASKPQRILLSSPVGLSARPTASSSTPNRSLLQTNGAWTTQNTGLSNFGASSFKRKQHVKVLNLTDASGLELRTRKRLKLSEDDVQSRKKERDEQKKKEKDDRELKRKEEREAKAKQKEDEKTAKRLEKERFRMEKVRADEIERAKHATTMDMRVMQTQSTLSNAAVAVHRTPAVTVAAVGRPVVQANRMMMTHDQMQQAMNRMNAQRQQHGPIAAVVAPLNAAASHSVHRSPVSRPLLATPVAGLPAGSGSNAQVPHVAYPNGMTASPFTAHQFNSQDQIEFAARLTAQAAVALQRQQVQQNSANQHMEYHQQQLHQQQQLMMQQHQEEQRQQFQFMNAQRQQQPIEEQERPSVLSQLLEGANRLTPSDRVLMENFLNGLPIVHPRIDNGMLQLALSESVVTDATGVQFTEVIVFEMNISKRSWRKLKRRRRLVPKTGDA